VDKQHKQTLAIVLSGVVLFACLMNFGIILDLGLKIFGIFLPIISGFIIAFVLNVPMCGFKVFLQKIFKKDTKFHKKAVNTLSLILTYILIVTLVVVIFTLIIPTAAHSLSSLYNTVLTELPKLTEKLWEYNVDISKLNEYIQTLDVNKIFENLFSGAGTLFSSVADFLGATVSVVANVGISIIISIYVLSYKDKLKSQTMRFMTAFIKPSVKDFITKVAKLTNESFTKFLSGQCVEAVILGTLIFVSFLIFKIPYAGLIGLLTGILSFIPFIGPIIACVSGAFFVLLAEPSKFIISIVIFLAIQYVEEQFIYPHVVGGSVGLSPLWTLIAVLLGGELFGVFGIFFSIPITAVIFKLIKEKTNNTLKKKQLAEKEKEEPIEAEKTAPTEE
jgi:predicted PurR-regulated permease PerM